MTYDAIVIGGGAAGLAGATTLARARRRVLVIDSGEPRNAPADGVHGFLGSDGIAPGELLARGRAELERYGGELRSGRVESVRRAEGDVDGFEVDGTFTARRLLVTTGLVDELPDVPGLRERWGNDVVHCPYCQGWEVRDQPLAVLATGPAATHQALLFSQLSGDVTLLLHDQPSLSDDDRRRLAARRITVTPGRVERIVIADGRITGARLADGQVVACTVVVVGPRFAARTEALAGLGLEPVIFELGGQPFGTYIPADPTGLTAVPGVWVAGNVTNPQAQVMASAAAGVMAAAAINADLIEAEIRSSVS